MIHLCLTSRSLGAVREGKANECLFMTSLCRKEAVICQTKEAAMDPIHKSAKAVGWIWYVGGILVSGGGLVLSDRGFERVF